MVMINGRSNVIKKVVVPRVKATLIYINSELEEKEREDTFRIKQFKKLKDRKKFKELKLKQAKMLKDAPKETEELPPPPSPPPPPPPEPEIETPTEPTPQESTTQESTTGSSSPVPTPPQVPSPPLPVPTPPREVTPPIRTPTPVQTPPTVKTPSLRTPTPPSAVTPPCAITPLAISPLSPPCVCAPCKASLAPPISPCVSAPSIPSPVPIAPPCVCSPYIPTPPCFPCAVSPAPSSPPAIGEIIVVVSAPPPPCEGGPCMPLPVPPFSPCVSAPFTSSPALPSPPTMGEILLVLSTPPPPCIGGPCMPSPVPPPQPFVGEPCIATPKQPSPVYVLPPVTVSTAPPSPPICLSTCMRQRTEDPSPPSSVTFTPAHEKIDTDRLHRLTSDVSQLGYFEKKYKEIVKVIRTKNADGTVNEEKKVITIKIEKRGPKEPAVKITDSDDSFDCKKESRRNSPKRSKSAHVNRSKKMGNPKIRSCMSSGNNKSTTYKNATTSCSTVSSGRSVHSCTPSCECSGLQYCVQTSFTCPVGFPVPKIELSKSDCMTLKSGAETCDDSCMHKVENEDLTSVQQVCDDSCTHKIEKEDWTSIHQTSDPLCSCVVSKSLSSAVCKTYKSDYSSLKITPKRQTSDPLCSCIESKSLSCGLCRTETSVYKSDASSMKILPKRETTTPLCSCIESKSIVCGVSKTERDFYKSESSVKTTPNRKTPKTLASYENTNSYFCEVCKTESDFHKGDVYSIKTTQNRDINNSLCSCGLCRTETSVYKSDASSMETIPKREITTALCSCIDSKSAYSGVCKIETDVYKSDVSSIQEQSSVHVRSYICGTCLSGVTTFNTKGASKLTAAVESGNRSPLPECSCSQLPSACATHPTGVDRLKPVTETSLLTMKSAISSPIPPCSCTQSYSYVCESCRENLNLNKSINAKFSTTSQVLSMTHNPKMPPKTHSRSCNSCGNILAHYKSGRTVISSSITLKPVPISKSEPSSKLSGGYSIPRLKSPCEEFLQEPVKSSPIPKIAVEPSCSCQSYKTDSISHHKVGKVFQVPVSSIPPSKSPVTPASIQCSCDNTITKENSYRASKCSCTITNSKENSYNAYKPSETASEVVFSFIPPQTVKTKDPEQPSCLCSNSLSNNYPCEDCETRKTLQEFVSDKKSNLKPSETVSEVVFSFTPPQTVKTKDPEQPSCLCSNSLSNNYTCETCETGKALQESDSDKKSNLKPDSKSQSEPVCECGLPYSGAYTSEACMVKKDAKKVNPIAQPTSLPKSTTFVEATDFSHTGPKDYSCECYKCTAENTLPRTDSPSKSPKSSQKPPSPSGTVLKINVCKNCKSDLTSKASPSPKASLSPKASSHSPGVSCSCSSKIDICRSCNAIIPRGITDRPSTPCKHAAALCKVPYNPSTSNYKKSSKDCIHTTCKGVATTAHMKTDSAASIDHKHCCKSCHELEECRLKMMPELESFYKAICLLLAPKFENKDASQKRSTSSKKTCKFCISDTTSIGSIRTNTSSCKRCQTSIESEEEMSACGQSVLSDDAHKSSRSTMYTCTGVTPRSSHSSVERDQKRSKYIDSCKVCDANRKPGMSSKYGKVWTRAEGCGKKSNSPYKTPSSQTPPSCKCESETLQMRISPYKSSNSKTKGCKSSGSKTVGNDVCTSTKKSTTFDISQSPSPRKSPSSTASEPAIYCRPCSNPKLYSDPRSCMSVSDEKYYYYKWI